MDQPPRNRTPWLWIETPLLNLLGMSVAIGFIVERRCKAGVVADSLGVIGRVKSPFADALRVVAQNTELAEGAHDLLAVVYFDDAVIVLVTFFSRTARVGSGPVPRGRLQS